MYRALQQTKGLNNDTRECVMERCHFFSPLMRIFLASSRIVGFQIITQGDRCLYNKSSSSDNNLIKFAEFL